MPPPLVLICIPLQGLMTTLNERSSIGQVVAYTIICGMGFGSVRKL